MTTSLHRQLPPEVVEIAAGVGERRVELGKLECAAGRIEPLGISRRIGQTVNGEEQAPSNVEHNVEEKFGCGEGRGTQFSCRARQEVHLVQHHEHRPFSLLNKQLVKRAKRHSTSQSYLTARPLVANSNGDVSDVAEESPQTLGECVRVPGHIPNGTRNMNAPQMSPNV